MSMISVVSMVFLSWLVAPPSARVVESPGQAATARLVTASWLAEHLNDPNLVLLHVGSDRDYGAAHISGARLATLRSLSTSDTGATGLTLQMLAIDQLKARLEALGVSDDSRIVVYSAGNAIQSSTRVLLTLDYAGLGDRASLLDGGLTGWVAAGRATSTVASPSQEGSLTALNIQPLVVDSTFVREHIGRAGFAIVDARTKAFYGGASTGGGAAQPHKTGHIEGAVNVPYSDITNGKSEFKSVDELRALFDAAGVKQGDTVVAYCHIGQQATAAMLAARLLGHPVLLYDGSFEEWSRLPNARVAK